MHGEAAPSRHPKQELNPPQAQINTANQTQHAATLLLLNTQSTTVTEMHMGGINVRHN